MQRETKQRKIILETLKEYPVHPNANQLVELIVNKYKDCSVATVFRNLKQLAKEGIIKKIDGLDNTTHFDHNIHQHYHFLCKKCGKIYDVSDNIAPELIKKAENETGFIIEEHDIVLQGICKNCIEKGDKND